MDEYEITQIAPVSVGLNVSAEDELTQIAAVSIGNNDSATIDITQVAPASLGVNDNAFAEITQLAPTSIGINVSAGDEITQIAVYSITSQPTGSGIVSGVGTLVGEGESTSQGSGVVSAVGTLVGEGESPVVGPSEGFGVVSAVGALVRVPRTGPMPMGIICCCNVDPCECDVLNMPDTCDTCLASDFAPTLSPQSSFVLALSGVGNGTNGCTVYEQFNIGGTGLWTLNGPYIMEGCELTTVASNTAFFNGNYVLAPCTGSHVRETVLLGCRMIPTGPGSTTEYEMVEYNERLIGVSRIGGYWEATFEMWSTVQGVGLAVGEPAANAIRTTLLGTEPAEREFLYYSHRQRTLKYRFYYTTHLKWKWDPTTCPVECLENTGVSHRGCTALGDPFTLDSDTSAAQTACPKALDLSSAVLAVTSA